MRGYKDKCGSKTREPDWKKRTPGLKEDTRDLSESSLFPEYDDEASEAVESLSTNIKV